MLSLVRSGKTDDELRRDVDEWVVRTGLEDERELLFKAALVGRDRDNFEQLSALTEEDKDILRNEKVRCSSVRGRVRSLTPLDRSQLHPYRQPKTLYWTVFMCSMAAIVQGMDETVINGANLFYPDQFGIGSDSTRDTLLLGLTASAPYLCSAVFSCWLTCVYLPLSILSLDERPPPSDRRRPLGDASRRACPDAPSLSPRSYPLNKYFGRRGAIFISTLCAGLGCIWVRRSSPARPCARARTLSLGRSSEPLTPRPRAQGALTNTWWHLFISRLFLGIGIGPKSATVPVFASEIAPARIRGLLAMQWQTWTAFGASTSLSKVLLPCSAAGTSATARRQARRLLLEELED